MITPIILAGGSGTRLWPFSKQNNPKQFQALNGEQSLLQATLARIDDLICSKAFIVCNNQHRFIAAEQLSESSTNNQLIIEPEGRNTLAAITVGCLAALEHQENPLILVTPSDHLIKDNEAFNRAISATKEGINEKQIVTFGIKPTRPETGFGYLKLDGNNTIYSLQNSEVTMKHLAEFVEKPSYELAREYINSENFYWNSGMFMAHADTFINLIKTYQNDVYKSCLQAYQNASKDLDFLRLDSRAYSGCPAISFDYGIMEPLCSDKNRKVTPQVMPLGCGWNDLGSWDAVHRIQTKDTNNNSILSEAIVRDSENCLVKSDNKLVTLLGIKNTIVIDTKEVLLLANMERAQDVKLLVEELKQRGLDKYLESNTTYRPWGKYEILITSDHHQIKKVTVKPGGRISLQKHQQRAEHWVIVSGVATVFRGSESFTIGQNESTFIPIDEIHRLENKLDVPLELIEVQTGDYFGEDDIERYDDEYGRG